MQPNLPQKRILVVEDDKNILDLILMRLGIAGYGASLARDGAEALESIRLSRPDAVILDIGLPKLDGLDVLRQLRAKSTTAALPILVLTARNSPEDVKTALALGAHDFMTKPFDHAQLLARLSRLLRARPKPPRAGGNDVLVL